MNRAERAAWQPGSRLEPDVCFRTRAEATVEAFGECSLVLLCGSLQMRRINGPSSRVLALVANGRTVIEVARVVAEESGLSVSRALDDVGEALAEMERQRIVRRVVELAAERRDDMSDPQYLANPDVSFRQEDDDGAILFNADTEALEVINPVAAEIWLFLAAPRSREAIVEHLMAACEGAEVEQVRADVGVFLEIMLKKGFVGIVEETP
jgi:hypothetical protein